MAGQQIGDSEQDYIPALQNVMYYFGVLDPVSALRINATMGILTPPFTQWKPTNNAEMENLAKQWQAAYQNQR